MVDGERTIIESTIIVEYIDLHFPGSARLIPANLEDALDVRFLDRFFDNYIQTPMQTIVSDAHRGERHDAELVAGARATLDTAYAWLEQRIANRDWIAGEQFNLADCAAAPALFYADWTHPIGDSFPGVRAYRNRLNGRPSVARTINEARPYRYFFPLGAPDRD